MGPEIEDQSFKLAHYLYSCITAQCHGELYHYRTYNAVYTCTYCL